MCNISEKNVKQFMRYRPRRTSQSMAPCMDGLHSTIPLRTLVWVGDNILQTYCIHRTTTTKNKEITEIWPWGHMAYHMAL